MTGMPGVAEAALKEIAALCRRVLGGNLVGVYVHGSLAFGCFDSRTGDIDFLTVVRREPLLREKMALIEGLMRIEAPEKGLEMSVVEAQVCRPFVYPTPFVLHYSRCHHQACRDDLCGFCENMRGEDRDLAAHFAVTRAVGYPLCGPPVHAVFDPVPRACYLDSIDHDLEGALDEIGAHPVYVTLNLCRALAYAKEGRILSKRDGGLWALDRLPAGYRPMVRDMLRAYAGEKLRAPDEETARAFCREMLDRISDAKK